MASYRASQYDAIRPPEGVRMGFFSRFFKFKEQDSSSPETTWAYEDNASELVLDPESAATLLTEIDIDAAIANHAQWKDRLLALLEGRSGGNLVPYQVANHEDCPLGQWLKGPGRAVLGHYPAFELLVARHKYFHAQAAEVVALAQAGDKDKALQLFQGGYRHASNQVNLLLKELRRGIAP